jgi:hypothetical protein
MLASLLLPKLQKIALLRLRSLPAFCLFLICDWDTHFQDFSRLLGTGVGKKNALNIVQMKKNGSNCPTESNLDKLSLKMREESLFMRGAWKQTKMREFHGNCGKLGRSDIEVWNMSTCKYSFILMMVHDVMDLIHNSQSASPTLHWGPVKSRSNKERML